jgi:hypothetical protein
MTALAEETNDSIITADNVNNDESNNNAENDSSEPTFCGVGMEDMILPCGIGSNAAASASGATATLPRELISRLSLLPDISAHHHPPKKTEDEIASSSLFYSADEFTCLCGAGQLSEDENDPIPSSVLSNPNRSICVVTTAALPWRTGTAVNPLLRALYLVRFQREHRQKYNHRSSNNSIDNKDEAAVTTDGLGNRRHQGSVALVIPWLESSSEREKLYGANNKFSNGAQGMKEQETWIKQYAKERCNMELEANELKYIWYPAFYLEGFGSIFPKVDLCNFIPSELVDVAILEEPEHLNWFRMPNCVQKEAALGGKGRLSSYNETSCDDDDEDDEEEREYNGGNKYQNVKQIPSLESRATSDDDDDDDDNNVSVTLNHNHSNVGGDVAGAAGGKLHHTKLGWTHRFLFVVGIVHTNYEEYARQYGIGASLIAAPAIGALSALTMRAYCHQVIKLSNTLPSFAPGKECTCNVHGVRREFLEDCSDPSFVEGDDTVNEISPVYFIGKLVWAKVSPFPNFTFSHEFLYSHHHLIQFCCLHSVSMHRASTL